MGIFDIFFGKKEDKIAALREGQMPLEKVEELIRQNKKLEAIKTVREFSSTGLKEAKLFVEAYEKAGFSSYRIEAEFPDLINKLSTRQNTIIETQKVENLSGQSENFPLEEIRKYMIERRKIEAIKLTRASTGLGLKEAKDLVEHLEKVDFDWYKVEDRFKQLIGELNLCNNQSSIQAREVKISWAKLSPAEQKLFSFEDRIKIQDYISHGEKILAIKTLRTILTRMGLKEAKDFIQELESDM